MEEISKTEQKGVDFNHDDGFFDGYEKLWEEESEKINIVDILFRDMKRHPENYVHPRYEQ